jgi:hypothetical protein
MSFLAEGFENTKIFAKTFAKTKIFAKAKIFTKNENYLAPCDYGSTTLLSDRVTYFVYNM